MIEIGKKAQVLATGEAPEKTPFIAGDQADFLTYLGALRLNIEAVDRGRSGRRQQQRTEQFDQGRLAGTVGAD